jgi:hypothetical protein
LNVLRSNEIKVIIVKQNKLMFAFVRLEAEIMMIADGAEQFELRSFQNSLELMIEEQTRKFR